MRCLFPPSRHTETIHPEELTLWSDALKNKSGADTSGMRRMIAVPTNNVDFGNA